MPVWIAILSSNLLDFWEHILSYRTVEEMA